MNDIIVFSFCYLPENSLENYQSVMDHLFRYRLSVHLPTCLPVCLPNCLPVSLPVGLPVFVPVCRPVCLPVYLSVALQVRGGYVRPDGFSGLRCGLPLCWRPEGEAARDWLAERLLHHHPTQVSHLEPAPIEPTQLEPAPLVTSSPGTSSP